MAEKIFDTNAAIEYIHQEIAGNGTNSIFMGRGLDIDTGEYDAEEIAEAIERGEFPQFVGQFVIV